MSRTPTQSTTETTARTTTGTATRPAPAPGAPSSAAAGAAVPQRTTTPAIRFGPAVCGDLAQGASREWLVADGRGGYATGTVSGLRTRRYHGMLVAPDGGPARRMLAVAALDAVLVLPSGARVPLGVHEWASGAVAPAGHALLESFTLDAGLPCWRWRVGGVVLERTLAAEHGRTSVAVVHRLVAGGPVALEVEALCTWRDAHGERSASADLAVEHTADGAVVERAYRLRGPGWQPGGTWYHRAHAREEAARGLSADEDLWSAGRFTADLRPGDALEVSCWAGDLDDAPPPAQRVVDAARTRAASLVAAARARDEHEGLLALAADTFVVEGPDVVAGYPWFGTWSRDTMTSYEGLFLETGRAQEGRALLTRYAATLSEGMLANTADTGATEYNTADATLWFGHAVGRHVERTGDRDLAAELARTLDTVVESHLAGTRYGIRIDPVDGLLTQGAPGYALTWMDARVDGVGVTPRIGKAVELNALWLETLSAARTSRSVLRRHDDDLLRLEQRARGSVEARYPAPGGGLLDVLDGPDGCDSAVRANQLLAVGLPSAAVRDPDVAAGVVRRAAGELLTPLGLRSLAPGSPGYRGRHRGGPADRDAAYHTGTVWPWLVGPFVDAAVRVGHPVEGVLDGLLAHLSEWGAGSVSETADGDPPHTATGCPFQAWSVAELLRASRRARPD
jgi:predicted glycogen debranching enzyme